MSGRLRAASLRPLGSSGVEVTALGLGCAPLGNLFTAVSDADAAATLDAAWDAGIRTLDTAPLYGSGLSEQRVGTWLAGRAEVVLASKVGRVLDDSIRPDPIFVDVPDRGPRFDFSAAGVRASLASSLDRLAVDHLDICWVHDPDDHEAEALQHALPTLRQLQAEGLVGAIGAGMNQADMLTRFVAAGAVDAVLVAGQYNLLDQHAGDALLPACAEARVGVVVGGVFGSGLLADPWDTTPRFRYEVASAALVDRARRMHDICREHGVSLLAAAIQFPLRHPAVTSIVVGARTAAEVDANVAAFETELPEQLWVDLVRAGHLPESAAAP